MKERDLNSDVQDFHQYYSELTANEKRKTRSTKKANRLWKNRVDICKGKIEELQQSKKELSDKLLDLSTETADKLSDLAKETAEIQSKLIMTEALVVENGNHGLFNLFVNCW